MNKLSEELLVHPATEKALDRYVANPVHAVLLTGDVGLGKGILARRLVSKVLDVETAHIDEFPYVKILHTEKQGIPIEQVRQLHDFFSRKVPGKQQFKRAVIIPDANTLTVPAQNALLKLLEEPPSDSMFVLTSSRARGLLPTIRSRVQSIEVHAPDEKAVISYFHSEHTEGEIRRALLRAGTNIAELTRQLTQTEEGEILDEVKQVLAGTSYDRLILLGKIAQDKEKAQAFVSTLGEVIAVTMRNSAEKGSKLDRWHHMQHATYEAALALRKNGNVKLVMSELALSM